MNNPPNESGGKEFIITKHAIQRLLERSPENNVGKDPEKTIKKLMESAYRIRFSPKYQALRILNNDCADAQYYYCSGWILVCSNGKVITVERQDDKKFGKDIFKIED